MTGNGYSGAGIGGADANITIIGGEINAAGKDGAAAIGAPANKNAGTIKIGGDAKITARGGDATDKIGAVPPLVMVVPRIILLVQKLIFLWAINLPPLSSVKMVRRKLDILMCLKVRLKLWNPLAQRQDRRFILVPAVQRKL